MAVQAVKVLESTYKSTKNRSDQLSRAGYVYRLKTRVEEQQQRSANDHKCLAYKLSSALKESKVPDGSSVSSLPDKVL